MNETRQLKMELISLLDLLPLEGLKLLAEFMAFLRAKFKLSQQPLAVNNKPARPFGLCRGEFVVLPDFDEPLPTYIIEAFEGA